MAFTYDFHGTKIGLADVMPIHQWYEAACTAEYVLENYPAICEDEDDALSFGYAVREYMSKYDAWESEAIERVAETWGHGRA